MFARRLREWRAEKEKKRKRAPEPSPRFAGPLPAFCAWLAVGLPAGTVPAFLGGALAPASRSHPFSCVGMPQRPAYAWLDGLAREAATLRARLDLHGFDEASARRRVHDTLLETRRQGGRCVLVIHGRGNRSPGGPVLKQALVGWLGEPAVGRSVLAFSSATNGDGGVGATYVLLKA